MERIIHQEMDNITSLSASTSELHFPLGKNGYTLEKKLNNANRWSTKLVCSILDKKSKRYVSTTYAEQVDYLKFIETTTYLKCNNKLFPEIVNLYPKENTAICNYVGEFLHDYLLNNSNEIFLILSKVFTYLKDINSINQSHKRFTIPVIIKAAFRLDGESKDYFELLPKIKIILPRLMVSNIKFICGCGIEDPHIWNFRIIKVKGEVRALTTDFDYFSNDINYFWELGYLYATFRWFKKTAFSLVCKSEENLLSLAQNNFDLKSEFMFWLGVLSSYCGYRDSLINFMVKDEGDEVHRQHQLIQQLDEKVFGLASKILADQEYIDFDVSGEATIKKKGGQVFNLDILD